MIAVRGVNNENTLENDTEASWTLVAPLRLALVALIFAWEGFSFIIAREELL